MGSVSMRLCSCSLCFAPSFFSDTSGLLLVSCALGSAMGSLVVYLVSLTSRFTFNRSARPFRCKVQGTIDVFLSQSFAHLFYLEMATSASIFNQVGEVPSIVEAEGTPLAAFDEGASVEVASTDFWSFLKEPAEVADLELQALLRKHGVDERIILEIGARGIKTIADFVCL